MSESTPAFPASGRLAGIDYGTVRIGIAVSDPDWILASPLENYDRKSDAADLEFFKQLFVEEKIAGIVVGLPVHTDGQESQKSVEAREFGKALQGTANLPVAFFDERYTSRMANEILATGGMTSKKKKKRLDMIAAQIMLSSFMESAKNRQGPVSESNLDLAD